MSVPASGFVRWMVVACLGALTASAQPQPTAEEENFAVLLDSPRLAGAPRLLREVVLRLLFDSEHLAFTQTIRAGRAHDGRDAVETIERYDPSQPPDAQWTLIKFRGAAPTAADLAAWRERKQRAAQGTWRIEDLFDFGRTELAQETKPRVAYRVPLGRTASRMFPREDVGLLVSVARRGPALDDLWLALRSADGRRGDERFAKAPALLIFVQQNLAPPPALLLALGTPGISWVSADEFREVRWSECRRVKLYDERFGVKIGPLRTLDF